MDELLEVLSANKEFLQALGDALLPVVGIFIAAKLAISGYFRQKEYELVKDRYLEGGIDIVLSEVEQALEIFHNNWAQCLQLFKEFRDESHSLDPEGINSRFLPLRASFHRVANHRVGELIGSDLIWSVYQSALAFATTSNSVVTSEMPEVIRLKKQGVIEQPVKEIVEDVHSQLMELDSKAHQYSSLISALNQLSRVLERERMTFQGVSKFRDRHEVKSVLSRLESDFSTQLQAQVAADTTAPG